MKRVAGHRTAGRRSERKVPVSVADHGTAYESAWNSALKRGILLVGPPPPSRQPVNLPRGIGRSDKLHPIRAESVNLNEAPSRES